jgi:hypothetical protein
MVAITSILAIQLLGGSVIHGAYALAAPASYTIGLQFNFDAAKGFGNIIRNTDAPEFLLNRGVMGLLNIDLTSYDELPVSITLRFGGDAPYVNWGFDTSLPDGIIYSLEPNTIYLAPGSSATATLRISATSDVAIKRYNISIILDVYRGAAPPHSVERQGHPITLTITPDVSPPTNTTDVNTIYVNRTITTTSTYTIISTSTTTQLSNVTNILTTTKSATLTNTNTTTTTSTITKQASDPQTYAWAVTATMVAVVLATVVLLQRRRTI